MVPAQRSGTSTETPTTTAPTSRTPTGTDPAREAGPLPTAGGRGDGAAPGPQRDGAPPVRDRSSHPSPPAAAAGSPAPPARPPGTPAPPAQSPAAGSPAPPPPSSAAGASARTPAPGGRGHGAASGSQRDGAPPVQDRVPYPPPPVPPAPAPQPADQPPVLRTATHLDLPTLPPPSAEHLDLPAPPPPPADRLDPSAIPPPPADDLSLPTFPPPPADHLDYVGSGPPTYEAEPTALPVADPDDLDDLVADTVLDGARYGSCTLRAVSVRGDSARYRGEPRRDSLLTARFGTAENALILVAMATGARATPGAHRAAAEACHWIGRAVGRSHARLAEDIRAARRGDLKSGLHRLTDRSLGKLRASAAEQGIEPEEYSATLRCLLLPADPECRTRVFFGVGGGGLFRLRDGDWQDIEPRVTEVTGDPVVGFGSLPAETPEGDRLTMDLGIPTPPSPYEPAPEPPREPFRFRASVARPGDTLLMCTAGLADPLRGEPDLCRYLTGRWSGPTPPGLAAFLADTQVRVKGYADDRTAAAVWEA
ncbi:protein phosphatase 2C domain-containing protein [Streptomyces sp. NPDC006476]|uniref:protein phosphatase 2C domain-containing protein n=1 Tax=Streptomyces sp. NPDC006476 TaxID=3157175 RepID=UPI0033B45382